MGQNLALRFIGHQGASFQCQIGYRILNLPKHYSQIVARLGRNAVALSVHSYSDSPTHFSSKLFSSTDDKIFTLLEIIDVYNMGIIQQSRMLESKFINSYMEKDYCLFYFMHFLRINVSYMCTTPTVVGVYRDWPGSSASNLYI